MCVYNKLYTLQELPALQNIKIFLLLLLYLEDRVSFKYIIFFE